MSQFPKAVFQFGGQEVYEGDNYTSRVVHSEDELNAATEAGWHVHPYEAKAAALAEHEDKADTDDAKDDDTKPPTRDELEQKAKELGIDFDGRTSDKKLSDKIAAALAA